MHLHFFCFRVKEFQQKIGWSVYPLFKNILYFTPNTSWSNIRGKCLSPHFRITIWEFKSYGLNTQYFAANFHCVQEILDDDWITLLYSTSVTCIFFSGYIKYQLSDPAIMWYTCGIWMCSSHSGKMLSGIISSDRLIC